MTSFERDYISVNRAAYDSLVEEYRKRMTVDRIKDIPLVQPFVDYLTTTFGRGARVLDIGSGNGVNLSMLAQAGLAVAGVDISPEMLKLAGQSCPQADLYLGDFLNVPFTEGSLHGIFAKASLHCCPKSDALDAFRKVHSLLVRKGLFYISTTAEDDSKEGYLSKDDYPGQPRRFRKHWTPREVLEDVTSAGFILHRDSYDYEADWKKRWYNIWAIRD